MKKTARVLSILLALLFVLFAFAACATGVAREGLWKDAVYTSDKTFGKGDKVVTLVVTVGEEKVTFTVKTDKETVGEALLDAKLIEGDTTEYGLYVKKVNGITADYNVDQSYWAFYIDGEYAMTGVDATPIEAGAVYGFTYTK